MILERDLGRSVGETQPADVLDSIIADTQAHEIFLPVDIDRADLMVGAGGWRHVRLRLCPVLICNTSCGALTTFASPAAPLRHQRGPASFFASAPCFESAA